MSDGAGFFWADPEAEPEPVLELLVLLWVVVGPDTGAAVGF